MQLIRSIKSPGSMIDRLRDLYASDQRIRRASLTTLALTASRGVGILVRLVSVPLALRLLGTERYGVWLAMGSILAWLSLTDFGIPTGLLNPLSKALAKNEVSSAHRLVSSAFFFLLGVALVVAVGLIVVGCLVPPERLLNVSEDGNAVREAFMIRGVFTALGLPVGIATVVLRAQQREYVGVSVQIAAQLLSLTALAAMTWIGTSLAGFALAMSGPTFLGKVAIAIWVFLQDTTRLRPVPRRVSREALRIVGGQGIAFFVAYIGGMVIMQMDNLVINYFLGPSAVPSYAVPYQLYFTAFTLIGFWMQPLWPAFAEAFAKKEVDWILKTYRRIALLSVAAMGVVAIVLGVLGGYVVQIWTSGSLSPPPALFWAMSGYFLLWTWAGVNATLLKALGAIRVVVIGTLASAAVNLAATVILVRPLGVIGVTAGSLVASILVDMWVGPLFVWLKLRELKSPGKKAPVL